MSAPADRIMLRARRLAILGEFLATIPDLGERAKFLAALRDSHAISGLGVDSLCEVYLGAPVEGNDG